MSEPHEAIYRFMKTASGVSSFAEVSVAYRPQSEATGVVVALGMAAPFRSGAEPSAHPIHPDWLPAAVEGAEEMLRSAIVPKRRELRGIVTIDRIEGTLVDTMADAVRCASALAIFRLFFPQNEPPPVSSTPPWRVLYDS